MTTINLLQSARKEEDLNQKQKGFFGGKALVIPLVILILACLAWGSAKFYLNRLVKEKAAIEQENKDQMRNLSGKNVDRIVDFQTRMEISLKETSAKVDYNKYLGELEILLVSGAKIDSLSYSSEKVELKVTADDFKTVARQFLSFKNSEYFKGLEIDKVAREKEGDIQFVLKK